MKLQVRASAWSLQVEVGEVDPETGQLAFGDTAEVFVSERYGSGAYQAEVGFAAIGHHDVERARRRFAAYEVAIGIAELIQGQLDMGQMDLEAIAEDLEHYYSDDRLDAFRLNR